MGADSAVPLENSAASHAMIFGTTSGALLIAQWPVPSSR